jgi:dTMP kinase
MSDRAELMLFAASRAQIVDEVIKPAAKRGDIVVCDRFYDSTTAYQAYGRGLDLEFVHQANSFVAAGIIPDMTILVDIPIDEIERRKNAAGQSFDRMESSGRAFYERVRGGYLALAASEPARFVRVNGNAAIETVAADIWSQFVARAPQYA